MRRKASNQNWGKNSMEVKPNKLTISTNYKSNFRAIEKTPLQLQDSGLWRNNITFGEN